MAKGGLDMKLKSASLISFMLSLIIVFIEYQRSEDLKDDLIRILILYLFFLMSSDLDFQAYFEDCNPDTLFNSCWYTSKFYIVGAICLFLQWIFNIAYVIGWITGSSTELF